MIANFYPTPAAAFTDDDLTLYAAEIEASGVVAGYGPDGDRADYPDGSWEDQAQRRYDELYSERRSREYAKLTPEEQERRFRMRRVITEAALKTLSSNLVFAKRVLANRGFGHSHE